MAFATQSHPQMWFFCLVLLSQKTRQHPGYKEESNLLQRLCINFVTTGEEEHVNCHKINAVVHEGMNSIWSSLHARLPIVQLMRYWNCEPWIQKTLFPTFFNMSKDILDGITLNESSQQVQQKHKLTEVPTKIWCQKLEAITMMTCQNKLPATSYLDACLRL